MVEVYIHQVGLFRPWLERLVSLRRWQEEWNQSTFGKPSCTTTAHLGSSQLLSSVSSFLYVAFVEYIGQEVKGELHTSFWLFLFFWPMLLWGNEWTPTLLEWFGYSLLSWQDFQFSTNLYSHWWTHTFYHLLPSLLCTKHPVCIFYIIVGKLQFGVKSQPFEDPSSKLVEVASVDFNFSLPLIRNHFWYGIWGASYRSVLLSSSYNIHTYM